MLLMFGDHDLQKRPHILISLLNLRQKIQWNDLARAEIKDYNLLGLSI